MLRLMSLIALTCKNILAQDVQDEGNDENRCSRLRVEGTTNDPRSNVETLQIEHTLRPPDIRLQHSLSVLWLPTWSVVPKSRANLV